MLTVYLVAVAALGLGFYTVLVRRGYVPMLAPAVFVLGAAGFGILRLLPTDSGETSLRTWIALAMIWAAWVGLSALIALALGRRMPDLAPLPALSGAIATLAPVAGFLISRTLA